MKNAELKAWRLLQRRLTALTLVQSQINHIDAEIVARNQSLVRAQEHRARIEIDVDKLIADLFPTALDKLKDPSTLRQVIQRQVQLSKRLRS